MTGLASAHAAIDEVIEQGEGARGDWRPAHYGRGQCAETARHAGVPDAVSSAAAAAAGIAQQIAGYVPDNLRPA